MRRGLRDIMAALLALVLCLAGGTVQAQPTGGPRSATQAVHPPAGAPTTPTAERNLQRRLWDVGQALRTELARAHPDFVRVRRLRAQMNRLWVQVTRGWYNERPWCGRPGRGQAATGPGYVPGPGFGRHMGRMGRMGMMGRGRFDW